MTNDSTLLRLPDVLAVNGHGRSTQYARIAARLCTPPIRIGARAVAWPKREIDAINEALISGASDEDIRTLVANLIAARTAGGADCPAQDDSIQHARLLGVRHAR